MKLFTFHLGFGEIQLIANEFVKESNSPHIGITVVRIHTVQEEVEVRWKWVSRDNVQLGNGTIFFNYENDQKIINLDLKNVSRHLSSKIELVETSNEFQLGKNKVANISLVGKL